MVLLRPPPLASLTSLEVTYPEVGASLGPLPSGYHHFFRTMALGSGDDLLERSWVALSTWQMHAGAGLWVDASGPAIRVGVVVTLVVGLRRFGLAVPCRVVRVLAEPQRRGFAYGTLPGHPERGEEAFLLTQAVDGSVQFEIRGFWRPSGMLPRLGGPISALVQRVVTDRYVSALQRLSTDPRP